jgi:hypothetical protein
MTFPALGLDGSPDDEYAYMRIEVGLLLHAHVFMLGGV